MAAVDYFCTAGGSRMFLASQGVRSAGLRIMSTASCAEEHASALDMLARPISSTRVRSSFSLRRHSPLLTVP